MNGKVDATGGLVKKSYRKAVYLSRGKGEESFAFNDVRALLRKMRECSIIIE